MQEKFVHVAAIATAMGFFCICLQTVSGTNHASSNVIPVVKQTQALSPAVPITDQVKVSMGAESVESTASSATEEIDKNAENIEHDLKQIGDFLSTTSQTLVPFAAALVALFAGLFLRKSAPRLDALKPMDMQATEATPLSRRGLLTALSSVSLAVATPAFAAKTGGRVGGSRFQAAAPSPRPGIGAGAGAAGVGAASGSSTVIVTPPPVIVAPSPPVYGFGMAPAMPYRYGMSYGFSTGEILALSAIELEESFAREQRRRAQLERELEVQRQLGRDQAQIEALQQQLASQDQRMRDLQMAMNQKGVPAPAQ